MTREEIATLDVARQMLGNAHCDVTSSSAVLAMAINSGTPEDMCAAIVCVKDVLSAVAARLQKLEIALHPERMELMA